MAGMIDQDTATLLAVMRDALIRIQDTLGRSADAIIRLEKRVAELEEALMAIAELDADDRYTAGEKAAEIARQALEGKR
jgi:hypothetical protein